MKALMDRAGVRRGLENRAIRVVCGERNGQTGHYSGYAARAFGRHVLFYAGRHCR